MLLEYISVYTYANRLFHVYTYANRLFHVYTYANQLLFLFYLSLAQFSKCIRHYRRSCLCLQFLFRAASCPCDLIADGGLLMELLGTVLANSYSYLVCGLTSYHPGISWEPIWCHESVQYQMSSGVCVCDSRRILVFCVLIAGTWLSWCVIKL